MKYTSRKYTPCKAQLRPAFLLNPIFQSVPDCSRTVGCWPWAQLPSGPLLSPASWAPSGGGGSVQGEPALPHPGRARAQLQVEASLRPAYQCQITRQCLDRAGSHRERPSGPAWSLQTRWAGLSTSRCPRMVVLTTPTRVYVQLLT